MKDEANHNLGLEAIALSLKNPSKDLEFLTAEVEMAVSVPGMMGSPALVAAILAATLSPILKTV